MEPELLVTILPKPMPSYKKQNRELYFGTKFVADTDSIDFEDLGEGYGLLINLIFLS